MRNPYQEIGGMRRKPLWERRHEGPAAVSTSLPFAFLEVPAPKKNEEKENFVATFAWGGGGYLLGRDWYLVGILVQLDWSLTNNLGVRGTN
jgi:hypothetical protein